MDGLDFNETIKYLIDAVSTSHWAEIILLLVILIVLIGGGYLMQQRIGSTERLMNKMLDMIAPYRRPKDDDTKEE